MQAIPMNGAKSGSRGFVDIGCAIGFPGAALTAINLPRSMNPVSSWPRCRRFCALAFLVLPLALPAQVVPAASTSSTDEAVTLSPFEVRTDKDTGYTATSTLAGSRLNTALRDTPASISVFTKEFLDDIGAINVVEALEYALNGSREFTDMTGNVVTTNDVVFQFRGFTGASLGRNYFAWSLSSDSYNIERLDFSRGPNSILFGIGGPGGILNTTTKRARIGSTINEVRLRVGSWDDYRGTVDINRTLVKGKFAGRANLLWQDRKGWRDFDQLERKGAALALTYRPFKNTEVRFDGEYGEVSQIVSQPWPAQEKYQGWIDNGRQISQTYGQAVAGTGGITSRQWIYDPAGGFGPLSWFGGRNSNTGVFSPALANNTVAITDQSILPFSANISGPGFTGDYDFYNMGIFVEQRFGPVAIEAAFNRQSEERVSARPQVFNDIALKMEVNARLPDGRPNPNVGQFFTDGQYQVDYRDIVRDDLRLTGSYDLDLAKQHRWLGQHTFAALISRREDENMSDGLNEVNITPAGDANYPNDLTSGNNGIRRRTYFYFSRSDPALRGLHDPLKYPIVNQNGVTSGMMRTRDVGANNLNRTDSKMVALQSKVFENRVVFTGGLRNDRRRTWGDTVDINGNGNTADDRDPVTRLFPVRRRLDTYNYAEGDTRTYGVVVHPLRWLSLFYNRANNFNPQSNITITGDFMGDRRGQGRDMGFRVNALDGKISAMVARYETNEVNRNLNRDAAFGNNINSILQTLGQQPLPSGHNDSVDTAGEGWELDLTANPLPNLRLSLNVAQTEQITSNIYPRDGAYLDAHRAEWQANAARPLTVGAGTGGVPTNGTIGDALRVTEALYTGFRQANGQSRRQLREYSGNVFMSYTFRRGGSWIDGLNIGGGANYRGDAVLGYDSTNNNAPIHGGSYVLANAMAGYTFKLKDRQRLRVQLNVDNLLGEDELIVTDADQDRAYRYVFQNPRRWSVTATYSF